VLGNVVAHGHGYGSLLGLPAQNTGGSSIPATIYLKARSRTGATTTIRVVEYE
jgi:hypothetical protein